MWLVECFRFRGYLPAYFGAPLLVQLEAGSRPLRHRCGNRAHLVAVKEHCLLRFPQCLEVQSALSGSMRTLALFERIQVLIYVAVQTLCKNRRLHGLHCGRNSLAQSICESKMTLCSQLPALKLHS